MYDVYMDVLIESIVVTFVKVWPEAAASLSLGGGNIWRGSHRGAPRVPCGPYMWNRWDKVDRWSLEVQNGV